MEFWDGEALESLTESIGKLLKVDELKSSSSQARFTRVCLELDLARPLKRGFWLRDEEVKVFVLILYERLPTFCYQYHCGLVGHSTNTCNHHQGTTLEENLVASHSGNGASSGQRNSPSLDRS